MTRFSFFMQYIHAVLTVKYFATNLTLERDFYISLAFFVLNLAFWSACFTPSWTAFTWRFRSCFLANLDDFLGQTNGFLPSCTASMCFFRLFLSLKTLLHSGHLNAAFYLAFFIPNLTFCSACLEDLLVHTDDSWTS